MSIIRRKTFATVGDKTEIAGCNSNDDVGGADNGFCWETSIKVVVGYAESRFKPRLEVVKDQLELRIIDMDDLCSGSQSKRDYDRLIERLKRGVWRLSILGGRNTASRTFALKWTLYAASACRLSGIAPEVVRREGY